MATFIPQQNEDAASAGGELAVPVLGVRNDSDATKTTTDGDFGMISLDLAGRVKVSPGSALGIHAEDSAASSGDAGVLALSVRNESLSTLTDSDGDYAAISLSSVGAVAVAGFDASDSGTLKPILVDGNGVVAVAVNSLPGGGIEVYSASIANSDTFSGTGNGALGTLLNGGKYYAIQVSQLSGTTTAWNVVVEVAIDGSTFSTVLSHGTADGFGTIKWLTVPTISNLWRARCTSFTGGGSSITVRTYVTS